MENKITMLGTLPPIKGVSDYCIEQTKELSKSIQILFFNFKSIYPEFLYPGGGTKEKDSVFQTPKGKNIELKNTLAWYNPIGWVIAGLQVQGQILHFHYWTFYLFPVFFTIVLIAKLRGKKIICTVHNVVGHESGLLDRLLTGLIFALPDKFIVHTKTNKEQMHEFFRIKNERVEIIPHGIYEFYKDKEIQKKDAKKKLSIPDSAKTILIFGNIRKYKGLEEIIPAFKKAQKQIPQLHLIIAGKPWNRELEEYIIQELANVKEKTLFLGYVPSSEIKYYFCAADLVVLPYKDFAAQSGPGNIALAFEKPLLVSNAGGLPELVKNKDAIFFAGDAKELEAKISQVFSKKGMLNSMQNDSSELREKYSWRNICKATLAIYNKL